MKLHRSHRPIRAAVGLALGLALSGTPGLALAQAEDAESAAEALAAEPAPETPAVPQTVSRMAAWVVRSGDNGGLPFAIVDKQAATVSVFGADGALVGSDAVLLGSARGDDSVPGIGDRPLSKILPEERTTPAGRFLAGYGPAKGMSRVLWVDFETAISMHPVVTGNRSEKRLERLSSPSPEDNRITYGCINVSADFYKEVVRKVFADTRGVVYVLPDTRPLEEVFPSFVADAGPALADAAVLQARSDNADEAPAPGEAAADPGEGLIELSDQGA